MVYGRLVVVVKFEVFLFIQGLVGGQLRQGRFFSQVGWGIGGMEWDRGFLGSGQGVQCFFFGSVVGSVFIVDCIFFISFVYFCCMFCIRGLNQFLRRAWKVSVCRRIWAVCFFILVRIFCICFRISFSRFFVSAFIFFSRSRSRSFQVSARFCSGLLIRERAVVVCVISGFRRSRRVFTLRSVFFWTSARYTVRRFCRFSAFRSSRLRSLRRWELRRFSSSFVFWFIMVCISLRYCVRRSRTFFMFVFRRVWVVCSFLDSRV